MSFTLFTRTILNRLLIGSQETIRNQFTINQFLTVFTRTRLNLFTLVVKEESWEEFWHSIER